MENKNSKSIVLGLTGQSGAGKTTVSDIMQNYGCFIINCDRVARDVVDKDTRCRKNICDYFGKDLINKDGSLDRKKLSLRVFGSDKDTKLLNRITHPAIISQVKEIINEHITKGLQDIIVIDAPQLFEAGADKMCDVTVCVTAPYELRKQRIMTRDNISEGLAEARLSRQHSTAFFLTNCDYRLDGSKDKENIQAQIKKLLSVIKGEA